MHRVTAKVQKLYFVIGEKSRDETLGDDDIQ